MRVVTSNIRDNPDLPRAKVRSAAAETATLGGVALFQEIGEAEDHVDLHRAMGTGWTWANEHLAIPLAFKTKFWQIIEVGFEKMHEGLAGTSPARYIAWAVVKRKRRLARMAKKEKLLAVLNTHFVSGAWSTRYKLNKEWRKENWNVHYYKMKAKIIDFLGRGISVLFGGDFNRLTVAKFVYTQKWLVQHGIDKIGFIKAAGGLSVTKVWKSGHTDTTSDHDAAWTNVAVA